jgi:C1A family cysteine protease/peptidoglycan hydrolase-like protein with peptidoglycan-binding domain
MMSKKGLGWVPDYPDVRDYTPASVQFLKEESDRTDEKISRLIHVLADLIEQEHHGKKEDLAKLKELIQAEEQETAEKISFRCARLANDVLAYGCRGKAVHALKDKLAILGYYPPDPQSKQPAHIASSDSKLQDDKNIDNAYYDRSVESAVREFQRQHKLNPNGIATSVTLAKITALASIATQAKKTLYLSEGDFGIGVIYLQQKLLTLQKNGELQIDKIDEYELKTAEFRSSTKDAVVAFQKKEFPKEPSEGKVGSKTATRLNKYFEKKRLFKFLMAPIPTLYFEKIKDFFLEIVQQEDPQALLEEQAIYPLIDVIAQLLPFLEGYNQEQVYNFLIAEENQIQSHKHTPEAQELRKALTIAYQVIKTYQPEGAEAKKILSKSKRLIFVAEQVRGQRGYLSSRELDTFNYGRQDDDIDQGAAVIYLQERLRSLGFYRAPTTGYFEELTEVAVVEFQRFYKLRTSGQVKEETKNKLHWLDGEAVKLLDTLLPEVFFEITCKIFPEPFKLKDNSFNEEDLSRLRSIAKILAQIVMPLGKHTDLEVAIRQGFATFQAIAQYTLIRQAMQNAWNLEEEQSISHLQHWWKILQNVVKSEQTQRILEVINDRALLERFEAPIATAIRAFKNSKITPQITRVIYGSLYEEIVELWDTLEPFPRQIDLIYPARTQILVETIRDLYVQISEDLNLLQAVGSSLPKTPTFVRLDLKSDLNAQDSTALQTAKSQQSKEFPPDWCNHNSENLQFLVNGVFSRELHKMSEQWVYLALPETIDLSFWCSSIEDQGKLNACTAHAGAALIEYFERRSFNQYIHASRLFLYKAARTLMQREGDSGASLRETMKAMVLFGVPPEKYFPYEEDEFDTEPSSFCYAYAQNYQAIRYFRLDDSRLRPDELLAQIKLTLVAGFPCMFGFTVYDSIYDSSNPKGHIPYPTQGDKREGGHSLVAVGYDDYQHVKDAKQPGAFLIRNSWGIDWGDRGYGWLPYDYVLNGLARDWWSLIKAEWIETGSFGLGSNLDWSAIGNPGHPLLPPG